MALISPFGGKSAVDSEPARLTATTAGPSLPTIPIERIRPGDWALAHNPELSDEERWGPGDGLRPEGNPDGWRLISMRLQKDDGGYVDIELLRPLEWIERHRVEVGGQVDVELTELGGAGWAEVFNIRACPPIGPPPGAGFRVVTGRYAHSAGDTFDLRITGLDGQPDLTIGVTATHPIWSVDEDDFVAAGDLLPGERLLTATGQIAHVHSLTPRPGPEPVYNLEVDVEHVYYVSHAGVLVHNAKALTCATPGSAKPPRSAAARLPKLKGKSEHQVRKVLEESGFKRTKVSNSPGRNETWVHPDGSEVRIHPYGNLKQAPYKSANNAHIHKQDPLGSQLNDRGFPSTNPVDTHIGIPNPGDFPTVRGRPHGAGTQ